MTVGMKEKEEIKGIFNHQFARRYTFLCPVSFSKEQGYFGIPIFHFAPLKIFHQSCESYKF